MKLSLPVIALSLLTFVPAPARADEEGDQLKALVDKHAASICTVRAVLKVDLGALGGGGGQVPDQTAEVQGVVVDAQGLVLIPGQAFSGQSISMMGQDFEIGITASDIKVTFENEDKEYTGFLAATDKDLGIAFVQIDDLAGRNIVPIAFDGEAKIGIGDRVATVSRLGKGYDYAPYYQVGRICGSVKKPRPAFLVLNIAVFGLPVFSLNGQIVGIITNIKPTEQTSMGGGNMFSPMTDATIPFLIPSKTVQGKIAQAKGTAQQMLEEKKNAKPAEGAPAGAGAAEGGSTEKKE